MCKKEKVKYDEFSTKDLVILYQDWKNVDEDEKTTLNDIMIHIKKLTGKNLCPICYVSHMMILDKMFDDKSFERIDNPN